ncbi:hypothetical protein C0V78_12085 [Novosphingobium sp. TH158]|nr:hypothetical protein C0V78_12085 [Novosphingobium sp. TH158]
MLEHLDLLCSSGAGLEAIAASACDIIRHYVGSASATMFWKGGDGEAAGFYHDCATAELKDLFVTRFEELFSSPDEPNMMSLAESVGPLIGKLVTPEGVAAFQSCNVYRYLCEPLGHHYSLDIRIEVAGRGVAAMFLFNGEGRPFGKRELEAVEPVQKLLAKAAAERREGVHWLSASDRTAHFVTDLEATRLLAINQPAERLLMRGHLLRQNVPIVGEVRKAPGFAMQLAAQLAQGGPASLHLPMADGRLVATATKIRSLAQGDDMHATNMSVSLDLQVPADAIVADHVAALPLTYLQKSIALFAMLGGARRDCEAQFSISEEALKKHLRAIIQVLGVSGWTDLGPLARQVVQDRIAALAG